MKKKIIVSIACLFLFVASFVGTNAVYAKAFNNGGCNADDANACRLIGCSGCGSTKGGGYVCIGCP
ncbi:MAG: hypothetical protein K1X72_11060 [Pyrinomonadaceae bacterium]|nr:hypothetical protein [Pyrinomonadaceae bacterium]